MYRLCLAAKYCSRMPSVRNSSTTCARVKHRAIVLLLRDMYSCEGLKGQRTNLGGSLPKHKAGDGDDEKPKIDAQGEPEDDELDRHICRVTKPGYGCEDVHDCDDSQKRDDSKHGLHPSVRPRVDVGHQQGRYGQKPRHDSRPETDDASIRWQVLIVDIHGIRLHLNCPIAHEKDVVKPRRDFGLYPEARPRCDSSLTPLVLIRALAQELWGRHIPVPDLKAPFGRWPWNSRDLKPLVKEPVLHVAGYDANRDFARAGQRRTVLV